MEKLFSFGMDKNVICIYNNNINITYKKIHINNILLNIVNFHLYSVFVVRFLGSLFDNTTTFTVNNSTNDVESKETKRSIFQLKVCDFNFRRKRSKSRKDVPKAIFNT